MVAPPIAGLNKANPGSIILSAEMMLRHIGWIDAADVVVKALSGAIAGKKVKQKVILIKNWMVL